MTHGAAVKQYCNVIRAPKGPVTKLYFGFAVDIASENFSSIRSDRKVPHKLHRASIVVMGGGGSLLAPLHFLAIIVSFVLTKHRHFLPRRHADVRFPSAEFVSKSLFAVQCLILSANLQIRRFLLYGPSLSISA